jgi:hypothetical protein
MKVCKPPNEQPDDDGQEPAPAKPPKRKPGRPRKQPVEEGGDPLGEEEFGADV